MRDVRVTYLLLVLLLVVGCGREESPETPAVAIVGGEPITAREFTLSYEFGFNHLKRGPEPRRAYLERMIDEKLLALEGYRLGLHENPEVRRQIETMRDELLVEQVFEREVNDRVTVTDEEIQQAMQRDRVQFKLRYLPAATLEDARGLQAEVREQGFDEAARRLLRDPEHAWRREDFESPYLSWSEIDPQLLEAVSDLPPGEVSEPIPFRGSYLVIQVVDIRRESMPPVTDMDERSRYEQVLFQQKAKAEARRYIGEMMGPLDLRVRPQTYRALRRHLGAWYADDPPADNLRRALRDADGPYADKLRELLPEVLMTTRDGEWTVEDFLRAYPIERYPLATRSEEVFESDLYDALGLTLRDSVFIRKARAEGLGETQEVREELERWADKWVYRALVRQIADTLEVQNLQLTADSGRAAVAEDRLRRRVREYLAALRSRYSVDIREEVLDTLSVTDPSGPATPGVLVFKGHTRRLAFPIVDPEW